MARVKKGSAAGYPFGALLEELEGVSATLGHGDSGRIFLLKSTTANTVTLPSASAGLRYKFIVTDSTAASTIVADSAILKGAVVADDDTDSMAGTTITVTTDTTVGDWLEIVSDGTNWYVSGHTTDATGFTVA